MTPYKDSISPFQEKVNVFSPKLENYQSKKSGNSKRMEPCKNRQENTMKLNVQEIGERIRNRRKELGLTQLDIKAATGISSGNISDIENGNRLPSASTLSHLSGILSCSVDWILTGLSPYAENPSIAENENTKVRTLIRGFQKLSPQDQEELLEILQIKLRKSQRENAAISSPLTDTGGTDLAG